jgi:hypothetical protein
VPAGYNQGAGGYPVCGGAMGGTAGAMAGNGTSGNGMAGDSMAGGATSGGTAAAALPPCSRTVTDRCTQTYERGVRRR